MSIQNILKKKFGDAYLGASAPKLEFVSTKFLGLDLILGGGLPKGRVVEVYGDTSTSKSTLLLTIAAGIQRDGGKCAYIDLEGTVDSKALARVGVVEDPESFFLFQGLHDRERTMDIVQECATVCDLVVLDSVPYLEEGSAIGDLARFLSRRQASLAKIMQESGAIFCLINQLRTTGIGSYVTKKEPTGGAALGYLSSMRLRVTYKGLDKERNTKKLLYMVDKIKWTRDKQFTEIDYLLDSGTLDPYSSVLEVLVKLELVVKSGSWLRWTPELASFLGVDEKIGQGAYSVVTLLKQDDALYSKLYNHLVSNYLGQLETEEDEEGFT